MFRQSLVKKTKVTQYLVYAFGEIILVVIGILLALQINIWNEEKKNQQESKEFIGRLLNEVRINIKHAEYEIEVETNQIRSSQKILNLFNETNGEINTVIFDSLIYITLVGNTVDINTATLVEGQNTGKITLVKSDSLRLALYNLPTIIEEIRKQEFLDRSDISDKLTTFLYSHYNYRNMDNSYSSHKGKIGKTHFTSFNNLDLLNSMTFENMMDNRFYLNNLQMNDLKNLKEELQLIEKLILKEISSD